MKIDKSSIIALIKESLRENQNLWNGSQRERNSV
jgi:hypothetical protein